MRYLYFQRRVQFARGDELRNLEPLLRDRHRETRHAIDGFGGTRADRRGANAGLHMNGSGQQAFGADDQTDDGGNAGERSRLCS